MGRVISAEALGGVRPSLSTNRKEAYGPPELPFVPEEPVVGLPVVPEEPVLGLLVVPEAPVAGALVVPEVPAGLLLVPAEPLDEVAPLGPGPLVVGLEVVWPVAAPEETAPDETVPDEATPLELAWPDEAAVAELAFAPAPSGKAHAPSEQMNPLQQVAVGEQDCPSVPQLPGEPVEEDAGLGDPQATTPRHSAAAMMRSMNPPQSAPAR
jgi:hypothetical protein